MPSRAANSKGNNGRWRDMDSGKGNLLVVDGDYSVRSSITEGLARHGYSVVGAASGEEGLNRLRSEDFDLVLLDLQLPDVNGIELLSRIRRDWDDVVVIMVSAVGRVETAVEAMQRGAFNYITKP